MRLLIGGVAALAVVAVAGAALYFFVLRDDAPDEVSLDSALEELDNATPTAGATAPAGSPAASGDGDVSGTWLVDTSLESFVGYRVQEELANIGATTAVGRTPGVEGSVVIDGQTVRSATFEADLTRLSSDDSRRDGQLRTQALETGTFPTATFTLTEPIELPAELNADTPVAVTAIGELTLHGVTRPVELPLEAQLSGDVIAVVGSLDIVVADYDIDPPQSMVVLSVDDEGVMEFQLFLAAG